MFLEDLSKQFRMKQIRTVRSLLGASFQIAKTLLAAATKGPGIPSILSNMIDAITVNSKKLLQNLSQKISAAGIHNKVVMNDKTAAGGYKTLDIGKFLKFKNWQNYTQLEMIKHDNDVFIDKVHQSSHNLKMYFATLMNSEIPINQGTLDFIQNKTYLFSSYINNNIHRTYVG